MKLPVALALVIGVIGAILTWLYVGPLAAAGLFIPATFLGAASYFTAGGTTAGLVPSIASNVWGIIGGVVALLLVGMSGGNALLIGLYVGIMTAVVILGALVPLLSHVPGTVLGFATTAAFGLLTDAAALDVALGTGPFTVMVLSFVIGNLYGWVSSMLVARLVGSPSSDAAAAA
ncbi:DUF1097 domain-containing protein [Actinomycetes bacterium KLBMP 9759]